LRRRDVLNPADGETAKLNGVNPQAYLTETLSQIALRHPINHISELMPWVYQFPTSEAAADHGQTGRLPRYSQRIM
jgi:hypothetical protein